MKTLHLDKIELRSFRIRKREARKYKGGQQTRLQVYDLGETLSTINSKVAPPPLPKTSATMEESSME